MLAVRLLGNSKLKVIDVPAPEAKGDEVVVKVRAALICGSDLHGLYEPPGEKPWIPGHEVSGEVVQVDKVTHVKVGDRVAASALIGCGRCEMCLGGFVVHCSNRRGVLGFTRNGGDAEYVLVPESALLAIPDWLSFASASLIMDPVGTPFNALKRLGLRGGQTVAVFGQGPMGLGATLVAKFLGARVIAVDVSQYRLDLASSLGAEAVINPEQANVKEKVLALTGGRGVDIAVECSGNPACFRTAAEVCAKFGGLGVIGECREASISPSNDIIRKELTIVGAWCFGLGDYGNILRLFEKGLTGESIITHKFPLSEAEKAYEAFASRKSGKVLILPHGE
jgi:propanol-preferring alcohol dehydrogenase